MRAYPFGLVFADDPARAEAWSIAHSKLTHRDPIALAACAAMAVGTAGYTSMLCVLASSKPDSFSD